MTATIHKAREIASYLHTKHRVRRVMLFGSVARGEAGTDSDIDLVISGYPKKDYDFIAGDTSGRYGDNIDILAGDEVPDHLRAVIARDGIEL